MLPMLPGEHIGKDAVGPVAPTPVAQATAGKWGLAKWVSIPACHPLVVVHAPPAPTTGDAAAAKRAEQSELMAISLTADISELLEESLAAPRLGEEAEGAGHTQTEPDHCRRWGGRRPGCRSADTTTASLC